MFGLKRLKNDFKIIKGILEQYGFLKYHEDHSYGRNIRKDAPYTIKEFSNDVPETLMGLYNAAVIGQQTKEKLDALCEHFNISITENTEKPAVPKKWIITHNPRGQGLRSNTLDPVVGASGSPKK